MLQDQDLNATAAFFATEKPRWNYPGIVDHQEVAGREQIGKVKKVPILHRPGRTVHNEEARPVPVRKRDLSNQLVRQVVVIILNVKH